MTVFIMRRGKFGHRDTDIHVEDGEMEPTKARRGRKGFFREAWEREWPYQRFHFIFLKYERIFSRIIFFVCLLPRL